MAFLVEDGTGLAGANSYGSVADLEAYWLLRGIDLSGQTLSNKQRALILATDHIDLFFGQRFFGYKATSAQALEFPRICLRDSLGAAITGVPLKLKYAEFEYAERVLIDLVVLAPDPTVDPSGLQVQASFKKVGPLEKRTTFTTSAVRLLKSYPKADAYLQEFIGGGSGSHRA